jgi:8-amino-3,8-dideoxy-alpha-D-manno-octulosonate transaminase
MEWGYLKYSTEELMEIMDVFNVGAGTRAKIRELLESDENPPDAGIFFRYYNPRSKVDELEKMVREKIGCKYALGVNSGTSALIAALAAAGVGPGDEVIIPGYTFFASAAAVVAAKAIPVITEIDESLTIDPAEIEKNITDRTKAVMPVHMVGMPCAMDSICEIAKQNNLVVIEDAAQSFGGKFKGKYLGMWGDIGCTSLNTYKVIGSGEGGLVMTDDEWLYTRAQSYHDTGACWRPDRFAKERRPGELFCGENYRMNELAGAVAVAQMRKLDWINERTRETYNFLKGRILLPSCAHWAEPNDPEGVCGYTLGILFDNSEQAVKAIKAGIGLGGMAAEATRGVRDWHVYWNWEQIIEKKTVTDEGCPFTCPHVGKLPEYSVDMCPRTKDIIMRLAVISIDPGWSMERAEKSAETLSKDLNGMFGGSL